MKGISIKVGTKVSLILNEPGKSKEEYYSKIIDMKENYIILDNPVHKATRKTIYFPVGTFFNLSFVGDDQAVYEFSSKIAARLKLKFPALAVPMPKLEDLHRIQRREFVRVDAIVDVAVHRKDKYNRAFTTVTSDISGGGLSLILPKKESLEMDEVVDIWLSLGFISGTYHYIHTSAKVVFIQSKDGIRSASVKFESIKTQEQQLIVSYCFEKQREMRKKEYS